LKQSEGLLGFTATSGHLAQQQLSSGPCFIVCCQLLQQLLDSGQITPQHAFLCLTHEF
jgi:hypothetical protein